MLTICIYAVAHWEIQLPHHPSGSSSEETVSQGNREIGWAGAITLMEGSADDALEKKSDDVEEDEDGQEDENTPGEEDALKAVELLTFAADPFCGDGESDG